MLLRRRPIGWSSRRDFQSARRDLDRLLQTFSAPKPAELASLAGVFPPLNVGEDEDSYYVDAEVPGMDPDELKLSVVGMTLSIAGERKIPELEGGASYHRREREAGSFRRSLNLPNRIEADAVTANYKNGILSITLPKAAEAKPRTISVSRD